MKKGLLAIFGLLISGLVMAGTPDNSGISARTETINALDTMFFDLSHAIVNGDDVQFPVYIVSDDTVNSLDFSFKYDQTELIFDSIINLTPSLQITAFYNQADSTVRFSSYSTNRYKNNTNLVNIRVTTIHVPINKAEFRAVKALLNGAPCSVKIIDALPTGFSTMSERSGTKIYPNPATDFINVVAPANCSLQLSDLTGKVILQMVTKENHGLQLNTQGLDAGIYILKLISDGQMSAQKLMISK